MKIAYYASFLIVIFQDELLSKAREFAQAREAQAELKAEIETYKELLSGEQSS